MYILNCEMSLQKGQVQCLKQRGMNVQNIDKGKGK